MKLNLLMFAAVAALSVGSEAMADPVRVGVSATPILPYQTIDATGTSAGWEIEIINAICEDQQLDCVLVPTAFASLIPELTGGKIDLIMSAMSITDKRLEVIDFSKKYATPKSSVVGHIGTELVATPEGLAGKTLGVLQSSTHDRYAQKHFPLAIIKAYPAQDEANQDLVAGRIDATFSDAVFLLTFLEGEGLACCEVKGQVPRSADLEIFGPGADIGVRKENQDLKEAVNTGLANILASGKYDEISGQYFEESIYE